MSGTAKSNGRDVPINSTMTMNLTEKVASTNADQTSTIACEMMDMQMNMPMPNGSMQTTTAMTIKGMTKRQ